MAFKNHTNLRVWHFAMEVAKSTYQLTQLFPKEEMYGLASQMQRAAVSIPSNIAEGYGRDSNMDFDRFLRIAVGSSYELQTQLELARCFGYVDNTATFHLNELINSTLKMIYALRITLRPNS